MKRFITIPRSQHQGILPHLTFSHSLDPQAPLTPENWRQIPLLTRVGIQENFSALKSEAVPRAHGKVHEVFSSGSTGASVRAQKSALIQHFWLAMTARFHLWNGDDMSQKYGAIKT